LPGRFDKNTRLWRGYSRRVTFSPHLFRFHTSDIMALNNSSPKKSPLKGDDRNIVVVDQDFGQPDLDDRIFLFWSRHRVPVLVACLLAVTAAATWIGWSAVEHIRLGWLQDEYHAAPDTPEGKLAFAAANKGKPLAGIAALEAADKLFIDKKFADAAKVYAQAVENFDARDKALAALALRARLGIAFAKIETKDAAAEQTLLEIADTKDAPASFRGRALYTLAILALEKKDFAAARKWLDRIDRDVREVDPNNAWVAEKANLAANVPELAVPTAKPADANKKPADAKPGAKK
jgi:hypothetical protein